MPASASLVSLDQARDWARRLHKATPAFGGLAKAQEAVAVMLGHASWHALVAFYQHRSPAPPVRGSAKSDPLGEAMNHCLAAVNARYPGLEATCVEVIANEIEEFAADATQLMEAAYEMERAERLFFSDAISEVLEKAQITIHAPPGHVLLRVARANGQKSWVTLPSRDYAKTL